MQKVTETLKELSKEFTGEPVDLDISFEQAGFDSLDTIEFIMSVEEEFEIEINEDDVLQTHTFNEFAAMVQSKIA